MPKCLAEISVMEGLTVAALDQSHVVANMGPIAVRGMWYPFVAVGVPQWAEERRTNLGPENQERAPRNPKES